MESSLSTYDDMRNHFKNLCSQSRYELRQQLLSKTLEEQPFQQQLSKAFQTLYNTISASSRSSTLTQLKQMFNIDESLFDQMNSLERKRYIHSCIQDSINNDLQQLLDKRKSNQPKQKDNRAKQFSWLDLNTKYQYLKPMFQQILLEKIRWFDQELGQTLHDSRLETLLQGPSLEISQPCQLDYRLSTRQSTTRCHSSMSTSKYCQISNRKINTTKDKFQKVEIRSESKFLKTEWTKNDEDEFIDKKRQLTNRFKKGSKIPIIYQFVKKYTETNKGRDVLLNKWVKNQNISEEELRYLCATSVFLNQSINKNQKAFIRGRLGRMNKDIVSRLQSSIAEKIIETYKEFTGKVSSIRSNYYLKTSEKTKRHLEEKDRRAQKQLMDKERYEAFLAYKKMFVNICNSKQVRWKLNDRVSRWVYYFIDKLKRKCGITSKRGKSKLIERLTMSASERMTKLKNKVQSKSIKFFKPVLRKPKTEDVSFDETNPQFFKNTPKSKFQKPLTATRKQNRLQSKSSTRFVNQKPKLVLQPYTYYTVYPSWVVSKVAKIQATWKMFVTRRLFKSQLITYRHQKEVEIQKQVLKLRLLYPPLTKIKYAEVLRRINQLDMLRILIKSTKEKVVAKKLRRCPEGIYSHFSEERVTQIDLQNTYKLQTSSKRKSNLEYFMHCCNYNLLEKLMKSNIILAEKDLNALSEGRTALCCAVKNKNHRLIELLLAGGAHPNLPDSSKQSPLHYAFKFRDIRSVFLLLEYKGDLNIKDSNNNTPLYYGSAGFLRELGLEGGIVTYGNSRGDGVDNNQLYRSGQQRLRLD